MIKAFNGSQDIKQMAMRRAAIARMGDHFYACGHFWHPYMNGKCQGNVSGAVLSQHLQPGQVEQDCPAYWEPELGIPWVLGELIDCFFSGLSLHDDKTIHVNWAEKVFTAIKPGADLSQVADKFVVYLLEQPEWLAAYADDWAHHVGMMQGIVYLRLCGIDQEKRIKDFYYNYIHRLHRHQTQGHGNEVRAAMRALCGYYMENGRGPLGYFIQHVIVGSATHNKEVKGQRWEKLSRIFLRMLEDA